MTKPTEYTPPATKDILARQNDLDALRLLIAQRRYYTLAKRWQGVRWFGLLVLGVAAPFISVLCPQAAVAVGAVTGLWLFVGRTMLAWLEARLMTKGAAIQEEFDLYIFQMPRTIDRTALPTLEEIAIKAGPDERIPEIAEKEKLLGWYPLDATHPSIESIAISQRANASYTQRLIKTSVAVWAIVTAVWVIFLVTMGALSSLTFGAMLLGVIFPVLPAALDVLEYLRTTWLAARDRSDLADTIQSRIEGEDEPISGQDLLSWQVQLYDLRRTTPQLPNWLYKLTRNRNETAMHTAARQLRKAKK